MNKNKRIIFSSIISLSILFSYGTSFALDKGTLSDIPKESILQDNKENPGISSAESENKEISKVDRVAGANRYETAARIFRYGYENDVIKHPVIVSGDSFADAITGGLLASEINSPILLVGKNSVPSVTKEALNDIASKRKAYIIGGEQTISKNTENSLNFRTLRLGGENRYKTAVNVNAEIRDFRNLESYQDNAATYNGFNFPDALVATPFVYQYNKGKEILLPFYPYIEKNSSIGPVSDIVFGGLTSVPSSPNQKYRLSGSDRYKTAVEVAKSYKTILNKDIDTVIIANGENYPDSLCAGPLASKKDAAILLTKANKLNKDTKEYIESNKNIKKVIIIGGETSVSKNVETEINSIMDR